MWPHFHDYNDNRRMISGPRTDSTKFVTSYRQQTWCQVFQSKSRQQTVGIKYFKIKKKSTVLYRIQYNILVNTFPGSPGIRKPRGRYRKYWRDVDVVLRDFKWTVYPRGRGNLHIIFPSIANCRVHWTCSITGREKLKKNI